MKTIISILLIAALGCNTPADQQQSQIADTHNIAIPASLKYQTGNTPDGEWRLIPALPSDTATGTIPTLHFMVDSKRVTGNTGCNSFSGTFNIAGNSLTFNTDLVSTEIACPGYDEAAFKKNFLRTNNFEINGDTLNLKVNQTPLSYWIKIKEPNGE